MIIAHCNDITLWSLFKETKHFKLRCRNTIKAIISQRLDENRPNREVVGELINWGASRKGLGKKLKDVKRDTPFLMHDLTKLSLGIYT